MKKSLLIVSKFTLIIGLFFSIQTASAATIVSRTVAPKPSTTISTTITLDQPSITVLSPNGGEVYQAGQQITVKWATTGFSTNAIVNVDLATQDANGNTYNTQAFFGFNPTTNDGIQTYTIPSTIAAGNNYTMRIDIGEPGPGYQMYADYSNALFSIQAPATTCTINSFTSSPTNIAPGGTSTLTWSTTGCQNVTIGNTSYPVNGSTTVGPLSATTLYNMTASPSTTTCTSTLPSGTPCPSKRAAVVVDRVTTPSITVVSPNGGEVFQTGQQITVKWTTSNAPSDVVVSAQLLNAQTGYEMSLTPVTIAPIGFGTANDGQEIFTLLSAGDPLAGHTYDTFGNVFKMRLILSSNTLGTGIGQSIGDYSNSTFTIQPPTTSTCTINSFAATPITVVAGGSSVISWDTSGCNSIYLSGPALGQASPAIGSYTENYGPNLPAGQNTYILEASTTPGCYGTTYSNYNGQLCVYVNQSLIITHTANTTCPANLPASVKVLAPNGGESYQPAQQAVVTWKTCKIPANAMMRIDLVMTNPNGGTLTRIIKNTINDGSETITLPSTATWTPMVYGNNFKIKVRRLIGNVTTVPQDLSDANFKIQPVTLTIATSPNTPPAQIVQVSNTATTNGVTLLKFTFKATGNDLAIDKVPVFLSTTGAAVTDLDQMVESMTLKINGEEYTEDVMTNNVGSTVVTFDNLDYQIDDGETVTVEVLADIDTIHTGFAQGDSLAASIRPSEVAAIDVENEVGDQLMSSQKIGSASGNPQTFYSEGIIVTSVTNTAGVSGASGLYTMKIKVTAFGDDVYLDKSFVSSANMATPVIGSNRTAVTTSVGVQLTNGFATTLMATDSNSQEKVNTFKIFEGSTANFTINVTANGTNAQQRAVLYGLEWGTTDTATLSNVYNIDMGVNGIYKTNFIYVPM